MRNKPKYHSEVFRCLSLSLNLLHLEVNSLTATLFRKTNDLFTKVSGSTTVLVTAVILLANSVSEQSLTS